MRKWSKKVDYNWIGFNSMLELKSALLIEDTCEYIIEPITIRYNRLNLDLRIPASVPTAIFPISWSGN